MKLSPLKTRRIVRRSVHGQPGKCCENPENYAVKSDGERCKVRGTVWNYRPQ